MPRARFDAMAPGSVATLRRWIAPLLCLALWTPAHAEPSEAQRAAFQKYSSCPSTGRHTGECPGYRIAYKVPLCAGGQDLWTNMLWLTPSAMRDKLRGEAAACAGRGNHK